VPLDFVAGKPVQPGLDQKVLSAGELLVGRRLLED
jgi:hypothetical protein